MLMLFLASITLAGAQNLIINGGFEADGPLGWWGVPTGWAINDFGHVPLGTDSTAPHAGSYDYELCRFYTGSTYPVLTQTFTASSAVTVSGWCKSYDGGGGTVRLRENLLGDAGTVRYWDCGQNAWEYNNVAFAQASGYYQMDTLGTGTNYSTNVGQSTSWVQFSFTVSALPGVTSYALDIAAPYFAYQGSNSTYNTYFDDISVTAVPEPSSILAMICGLTGLCGAIIRRRA